MPSPQLFIRLIPVVKPKGENGLILILGVVALGDGGHEASC